MNKIFLGFILSLFCIHSEAGRIMRVIPIDTLTGWSNPASPRGSCVIGIMRHVLLVNVSNQVQTVTITTKDTQMDFDTCNTGLSGAWVGPDVQGCSKLSIPTYPDIIRNVTLQPAGSPLSRVTVPIEINCRITKSGVRNCSHTTLPPITQTDLTQNMLGKGITTQIIEVAEDKGAIIATVFAGAINYCTELKNNTRFNILVNSGRAF